MDIQQVPNIFKKVGFFLKFYFYFGDVLREIWDLVSDPKKLQIRLVGDQITKARFTEDSGFPEF